MPNQDDPKRQCVVPGCADSRKNKLFVPTDFVLRKHWLKLMKIPNSLVYAHTIKNQWGNYPRLQICIHHFEVDDFEDGEFQSVGWLANSSKYLPSVHKLKNGAFPTNFPFKIDKSSRSYRSLVEEKALINEGIPLERMIFKQEPKRRKIQTKVARSS